MTQESMIERVARAIWRHKPNVGAVAFEDHPFRENCYQEAFTAIAAYEAYRSTPLDIACGDHDENEEICIRAAISTYLQPGDNSELVGKLRSYDIKPGYARTPQFSVAGQAAAAIEVMEHNQECLRATVRAMQLDREDMLKRCAELEGLLTKAIGRLDEYDAHMMTRDDEYKQAEIQCGANSTRTFINEARTALNNTENDDEASG